MEDGHVSFHSYLMDIGLEILNWEGHFVRESSCTSLFKSISISLWIFNGVHLLMFVCELSGNYHLLVSILLCILCVRDKWHFPRDSRSLSFLSLHTLVNWLFSMAWFEQISANSFSFDLFVPLIIFHSPCLRCSLFISIYIPCSIFSTHHSYTSYQ